MLYDFDNIVQADNSTDAYDANCALDQKLALFKSIVDFVTTSKYKKMKDMTLKQRG
jgi:hypothetical protein